MMEPKANNHRKSQSEVQLKREATTGVRGVLSLINTVDKKKRHKKKRVKSSGTVEGTESSAKGKKHP